MFADRVADGALVGSTTLTMTVGTVQLRVTRRLRDMAITGLVVNDESHLADENHYQSVIAAAAGLPTFGDWLLFLRYLVFYFEDRRALVWDPSAQRQLIRLLFFSTDRATEWASREREIQALDSKMRNLQAAVTRQETDMGRQELATRHAPAVREELDTLAQLQEVDEPRLAALTEQILTLDSNRQRTRLAALQAERDHESAFRNLERLELASIDAAFPSAADTGKYILAQLFSDATCLACGTQVPDFVAELRTRIEHASCLICGSDVGPTEPTPINSRAVKVARRNLAAAVDRLEASRQSREEDETRFNDLQVRLQALTATVAERRARIDDLIRRLPPDEAKLHERRGELATLRGEVEAMRAELVGLRADFQIFIDSVTDEMSRRADAVKKAFAGFASGFMLDETELVWAPHKDTVGQSGQQVSYPAFELSVGNSRFLSAVRRSEPYQVSESQREFIDLAFRMTLILAGTSHGVGSLVIDAPESSLDAVFVKRAAEVLTRFADGSSENRLVITSNLIDGDLIPELLRNAQIRSASDPRVVDLLRVAAPTRATTEWADDYKRVRQRLFARAARVKA
jgi:hypothetical protein